MSLALLHWYGWVLLWYTLADVLYVGQALAKKTLNTGHVPVTAALVTLTLWMMTP